MHLVKRGKERRYPFGMYVDKEIKGSKAQSLQAIPSLHALYATLGIDDALLSGEERVAGAAYLYPQLRFGGSSGKGVAAGAGDLGFCIVLRMDLGLHLG